jgi:hypothetical protein
MKASATILAATLLIASAAARAGGGGVLYHDAVATRLTSAYAYAVPDAFEPSKKAVVVVLSSAPIDAAAFDAAEDRKEAVNQYLLWKPDGTATSVTLMIGTDANAPVEQISLAILTGNGLHSSASVGSATYVLDLARNDAKRIEGTFRSRDESRKTDPKGDYYDLHFALNVASGKPFGPGLPPDGGEPFKAYQDYAKALSDVAWRMGDDEMQRFGDLLTQSRIDELNATQGGNRKTFLKNLHEAGIRSFQFVSGRIEGDRATLELSGKNAEGAASAATVTMKKEGKYWCFDREKLHAAGA